jgi:hypothetical protein
MRTCLARLRLPWPLLGLLALLAACSNDAPRQYLVTDLRILAIRDWVEPAAPITLADGDASAWLGTADRMTLEALVADPGGDGFTVTWYACPPIVAGAFSRCLDPTALRDLTTFAAASDVFLLGTGTPTADGASVAVDLADARLGAGATLDGLFLAGVAAPDLACGLWADLPVVAIAEGGGRTEVAVKRVRLTPETRAASSPTIAGRYVRNANPGIQAVLAHPDPDACTGGAAPASPLGPGAVALCAAATPESVQGYSQCKPGGELVALFEELAWQWYVSGGSIASTDFDGNASADRITFTPGAAPFSIWVILRDGRGGTDWRRFDL